MKRLSLLFVLVVLAPARSADEASELAAYDEKVLKDAGIGTNGADLLTFFKKRTLSNDDLLRVPKLIRQLGHNDFDEREDASKHLIGYGAPVLSLLRPAVNDADPEVVRRAREAVTAIEAARNLDLPLRAARVLARSKLEGAVPVLVNYLPFADDDFVTAEVLDTLAALGGKTEKVDPVLVDALKDPLAAKRAAAGYVLGRRKEEALRDEARKLLADRDTHVRFRTAQGLLAGMDKSAVPTFIDLASQRVGDLGWQSEDVLIRLAGNPPDDMKLGDTDADRKARRDAWMEWWKANEKTVDLAKAATTNRFLNYTLVPEMHANKVWEIGADKQTVLWEVAVPGCPIDAQALPGGRFLVAELNAHQVTERDRSGKILWKYEINTPIACKRLPNGHTFIGTNSSLHVVTPEGKDVMTYKPEGGFFIHSVQRLDNGHMVCVSMEGAVREIDAAGKEVRTVPLPIRGSWSGVEGVPGGRYLAVNNGEGKVLEVDHTGKIVWEYQTAGACYASRLPNGNTLVVSNNNMTLYEVNRNKEVVWEKKVGSSVWRAHRR